MYLIDSSVWIEFLRPNGSDKAKARIREIFQEDGAATCGIVMVEMARGARTKKEFDSLYESLGALPNLPLDEGVSQRAAEWGYLLDRKGKTRSTTDLLIAAAAYKKARLVHMDNDFDIIAETFGLETEKIRD